ncbi:MAG: hypothetical protein S4CHLAM2_03200 [Chlamydiales bacterium]|nr:hypothetical protein [Chlamydiales bacterium]
MATPDHTRMSIDIPDEEHRKLKAIAALRGVSMKAIILECLSRELYSDNSPNKLTERAFQDSDKGKNIQKYKDLDDLRSQLGI